MCSLFDESKRCPVCDAPMEHDPDLDVYICIECDYISDDGEGENA